MTHLLAFTATYFAITNGQTTGSEFTQYDSYNDWMGATLQCEDNVPCVINCYGFTACQEVDIIGPKDNTLTVNCNGNYADNGGSQGCVRPTIYSQNCTQLIMNVYNDDHQFYGGTIYTPTQMTEDAINTYITCGIIASYTKQGVTQGGCLESQRIYSIEGFKSVEWTYHGSNDWSVVSAEEPRFADIMYCGSEYKYSCTGFAVSAGQLTCQDTTSPCAATKDSNTITTTESITTDTSTTAATTTDTCDSNNRWDFADCSDTQEPKEESILFDVSLDVCLMDDRFTRVGLWNLFKSTYGKLIRANMNSKCNVNVEVFYVESYEYKILIIDSTYTGNTYAQNRVNCDEICDTNAYGYSLSTQIALFCDDTDAVGLIYEVLLKRIDSGAFHGDFKDMFLGLSAEDDSVCQKGLGSIQVTSATLRWRDVNGDDVDVTEIYAPNYVQGYKTIPLPCLIVTVWLM